MNRTARLTLLAPPLTLALLAPVLAQGTGAAGTSGTSKTVTVPREKISLVCDDSFYKAARTDFILQDEVYPRCSLVVPLALKERWPGKRTYYVIPRVSANLYVRDDRGNGRWPPLSPLVTPGDDALHATLESADYEAVKLNGRFGKLTDVAGKLTADTVGAGGKITVCVAPVRAGEAPCVTFDITARFKVYKR